MAFQDEVKEILAGSSLFQGLEQEILDRLTGGMQPVTLKKGETLFLQQDTPDGCYCILDGALKVSVLNEEGEEAVLAALGAGDILGEMGLIDNAPRSATITALNASRLGFLSTSEFNAIADKSPALYRHLLQLLCARLRATNDSFTVRQSMSLEGRLAHTLLRLADGFGNPLDGDRVMIFHKFTQSDLGDMVGAARENISRQLNAWCREGVLSKISGYYCIEQKDILTDLAKSD